MKYSVLREAEKYIKLRRSQKRWHQVMTFLASLVVFCTTYALILPAITMEREQCGIPEHIHSQACYEQVESITTKIPVCTLETLGLHEHTAACFDAEGEAICGYADFVVHTHDSFCRDDQGKLVCLLPVIREHRHTNLCPDSATPGEPDLASPSNALPPKASPSDAEPLEDGMSGTVTAGEFIAIATPSNAGDSAEAGDSDDDADAADIELINDLDDNVEKVFEEEDEEQPCDGREIILHEHTSECFDENSNLICGMLQVLRHIHSDECFELETRTAGFDELTCQIQEEEGGHQHGEHCYGIWIQVCGMEEHTHSFECQRKENDVVVWAQVELEGEDETEASRPGPHRMLAAFLEADAAEPGDIENYLSTAGILVNGEPYDGQTLNPGEQFQMELKWKLERAQLSETLTYTYHIPEQIKIEDVEQAILYDENNNRKGVYSIQNGVLTVTYDNVADVNITTFKLNASWNQDEIGQETIVKWNDELNTVVKFDNSQIAAIKELLKQVDMQDGSLVGEYAVSVIAKSAVNGINLTDTLTSEKFHFAKGYYEENGKKYDYRIKQANGSYLYGSFNETTNVDGSVTVTFPEFDLPAGGKYTVEYGVKLDADDRFELDRYQTPAGLRNSATASYVSGGDTISSTVTVEGTYRAEEKWVVKQQGDAEADHEVPWTIKVNNAMAYDMGGAVIGDKIETEGVVYNTEKPLTITEVTKNGVTKEHTPTEIILSDQSVEALRGTKNAIDALFGSAGAEVKREIEQKIGKTLNRENISDYVFVGDSRNQFAWFTPETGTPTSYELSYYTDVSKAAGNIITNSASAGWKQWHAGDVVGGFIQEVELKKENSGVRQESDDYFVDWTITLDVPQGRNALENVFLYDTLPDHDEVNGYDWLVDIQGEALDFSMVNIKNKTYQNELLRSAFKISSNNSGIQSILNEATVSIGNPNVDVSVDDLAIYGQDEIRLGQLWIINAAGTNYEGKRGTIKNFGIWLGTLPASKDAGYQITVKYTTKVTPALIDQLNGTAQGTNHVVLAEHVGDTDVPLADAESRYWVNHTTVKNMLDKNVADFDPDTRILTYRVEIDPLANLTAIQDVTYQLKDVLNLPGATYVEDSFILAFRGKVDPDSNAFKWDGSENSIIWRSDQSVNPEDYGITADQASFFHSNYGKEGAIQIDITEKTSDSNDFALSIPNPYNVLALAAPEEYAGKLAPMTLTYQVQLPENAEEIGTGMIRNSASLYMQKEGTEPVLLDGVKAEFDYSSALHKKLTITPNSENGYVAAFSIDVDKTVKEWPEWLTAFTVQDDMSKSLTADVTSIHVYGYGENGQKVELKEGITISYNDQADDKNTLLITVSDQSYQRYQIIYNAKLDASEANTTVPLSNTASILGTEIKSETVEKDVFVQEQDAGVVETNYQVTLLKFDASNTAKRLKAAFDLYVYENSEWNLRKTNIQTSEDDGTITLKNSDDETILSIGTWYKLVETTPPSGYIASTTYFHLGQVTGGKPQGVGSFTTIPLDGGTHQIPNYKATLTLHKVDAADKTKQLSDAEFTLYSDSECSMKIGELEEGSQGIYSISMENLIANQTYYLKETKAPEGYLLPGTVYQVSFDEKGKVTLENADGTSVGSIGNAYQIPNETSYELPETGGSGTIPYTLGGLLITSAAYFLLYNKKRRRRGDLASS